jgi:hypothetical protein
MSIYIGVYGVRIGLFSALHLKLKGLSRFSKFETLLWLSFLIILCCDVHPNQRPESTTSTSESTITKASTFHDTFANNLTIVHYNVQSFLSKNDILLTELSYINILAFTETWLSLDIDSSTIHFENYSSPHRKDRITDNYGGILVYVKDSINVIRRFDLEISECIWIEIKLKHKKISLVHFIVHRTLPQIFSQI